MLGNNILLRDYVLRCLWFLICINNWQGISLITSHWNSSAFLIIGLVFNLKTKQNKNSSIPLSVLNVLEIYRIHSICPLYEMFIIYSFFSVQPPTHHTIIMQWIQCSMHLNLNYARIEFTLKSDMMKETGFQVDLRWHLSRQVQNHMTLELHLGCLHRKEFYYRELYKYPPHGGVV